jgi:transposase
VPELVGYSSEMVVALRENPFGLRVTWLVEIDVHGSAPIQRYTKESKGEVIVEHLPAYSPDLNPDEQVWNHAKARLGKLFVATKEEFKVALFSIMLSIQRTRELVRSFFQLPSTIYAANAL